MDKRSKIKAIEGQYDKQREQPLQGDYSDEVFAALDSEDDTLPILSIEADITQPRHVFTPDIRGDWNGSAVGLLALLERLQIDAGLSTQTIVAVLHSQRESAEVLADHPHAAGFIQLLELAANIRDIGLRQSIGVVKRGNVYRIVWGERRWIAFHILALWDSENEGWYRIPARVVSVGEWELAKMQAAENFQRSDMNAIGKARQFAKLLMIARRDAEKTPYDSWNQLVVNCDRGYWAQVANGEIHRIPRGMGPQFEQALKMTVEQMRQYRNLLRLTDDHEVNDAIWNLGDAGDWAERFMREMRQYLSVDVIRQILSETDGYTVTAVTVSKAEERFREAIAAAKVSRAEGDDTSTETPLDDDVPDGGTDDTDSSPAKNDTEVSRWLGKDAWIGNEHVFVVGKAIFGTETVRCRFDDGREDNFHVSILFALPPDGDDDETDVEVEASDVAATGEAIGKQATDKPKEPPSLKDVSTSDGGKIRILRTAAFEDERIYQGNWNAQLVQRQIMRLHGKNQHTTICHVPECGWIALDHDADKLAHSLDNVKQPYILCELQGTRVCLVKEASRAKFQSTLNDTNAWYILYNMPDQHTAELTEYFDEVLAAAYNAANWPETPDDPDDPEKADDGAGVAEAADDFDFEALLDAVQLLADWVGLSDEGALLEDCKHFDEEAIGESVDTEGVPHVTEVLKRYAAASANIFEAAQRRIEGRLTGLLHRVGATP